MKFAKEMKKTRYVLCPRLKYVHSLRILCRFSLGVFDHLEELFGEDMFAEVGCTFEGTAVVVSP